MFCTVFSPLSLLGCGFAESQLGCFLQVLAAVWADTFSSSPRESLLCRDSREGAENRIATDAVIWKFILSKHVYECKKILLSKHMPWRFCSLFHHENNLP